jgi:hypothetical protein
MSGYFPMDPDDWYPPDGRTHGVGINMFYGWRIGWFIVSPTTYDWESLMGEYQ